MKDGWARPWPRVRLRLVGGELGQFRAMPWCYIFHDLLDRESDDREIDNRRKPDAAKKVCFSLSLSSYHFPKG